ncbi:MAG: AMP-binding protein [bacterium]
MLKENLVNSFEKSFKNNWNKPCFSDYEKDFETFGEIAAKIKKIHSLFETIDLKEGDKVAVAGKNSVNWGIAYLATVTYGAVIVPILSDFADAEIEHIVSHSESKLFFVADLIFNRLNLESMQGLKAVFSIDNFKVLHNSNDKITKDLEMFEENFALKKEFFPEDFSFKEVASDKLASIVYTSGTTGFSKGVMLSHNCLMANVQFFLNYLPVSSDNCVVSFLPLAHSFGCAFDFLSPVVKGCHIIFLGRIPSPNTIIKAFNKEKPVVIFAVPLILEKIYRAKIMPLIQSKKMKILLNIPVIKNIIMKKIGKGINEAFGGDHYEVVVGGAAFNPEIEEFFMKAGVKVTVGYGMTECGPLISYWDYYKGRPVGSCGKVIDYLDIKIDNPDEHGVGEICVKGENIMDGYYKMEEETAEAIDSEGWLHTGDLAHIDKDGFIFISGRSKNMILSSSGQNIYPEEIEAKINFMPFVSESLVLDAGNGRLVAFVYPDKGEIAKNNISNEELLDIMQENRAKLNEILPVFARVMEIKIHEEEFEKTSTKKIKRRLYTHLVG